MDLLIKERIDAELATILLLPDNLKQVEINNLIDRTIKEHGNNIEIVGYVGFKALTERK